MKPGAILTEREAEQMKHRLERIQALTKDLRIKEHCRMGLLTIKSATKRATKYQGQQEGLLFRLKSIL